MRPPFWNPPIELSASEQKVAQRIRKAKLFLFLRQVRHELFDVEFQQELVKVFKDSSVGLCPVAPAQIALAIILQAYTGVSDDEAIEAMVMDRRWQLVLDCVDREQAPFGKGTLVRFRAVLIACSGDRKSWRVRNGKLFDKNAFILDWDNSKILCPNGISLPFVQGQVVHFPKNECNICPLYSQCTESKNGRSVSIHADEREQRDFVRC
jgi:hypothetical protein